jgi:hypothetical protein
MESRRNTLFPTVGDLCTTKRPLPVLLGCAAWLLQQIAMANPRITPTQTNPDFMFMVRSLSGRTESSDWKRSRRCAKAPQSAALRTARSKHRTQRKECVNYTSDHSQSLKSVLVGCLAGCFYLGVGCGGAWKGTCFHLRVNQQFSTLQRRNGVYLVSFVFTITEGYIAMGVGADWL